MLFSRSGDESPRRGPAHYNFSEDVRTALRQARDESIRLKHEYVGTEHILLGLIHDEGNPAARILATLGVDFTQLRHRMERIVKPGPRPIKGPDLPYTSRGKKTLELAMSAARELRHSYVGAEHVLVGLLREEKGIAAQVLRSFGVTPERALGVVLDDAPSFTIHIDDTADRSIYQQVVDRVQEGVATGALKPGDRLPTVRRLADDLDIAPGTVARAYAELERLGVVITEGTRGTRVAPRSPASSADAQRGEQLVGLLRPVAVAGYHLGATAQDLRTALERAMEDIYRPSADA